jgi:two-component system, chemotaxis family, sensor kinase CheA
MFGQAAISEVVHAAETLVVRHDGSVPPAAECTRVITGLDTLSRFLRDELGTEAQAAAALAELQRALAAGAEERGEAAATADATPAVIAEAPQVLIAEAPQVLIAEAPQAPSGAGTAVAKERWTQVSARQVDDLCGQVAQFSVDFRALVARFRAAPAELPVGERRALVEDLDRCRVQLEGVAGASWALQLQSIEPTLGELVRHARELALGQGKRLRGVVTAAGAQVERSVLDALWEPLLHIVRNAVDHGIEAPAQRGRKSPEATLTLRAEPAGATVLITIADDGGGVDAARVRETAVERGMLSAQAAAALSEPQILDLLFQHGFSTRSEVSDLSGRGIGLDVVRSVVEELGGSVSMTSRSGEGTEIVLTIPARLSQEKVLVVQCGDALCGLPARQVVEVVRRREGRVEHVSGGELFRYRDMSLPFHSLSELLRRSADDEPWVLVLSSASRRSALAVPALVGEHELLRRPLDRALAINAHLGGSATLDDGRLVLLLALAGLLRRGALGAPLRARPAPETRQRHFVLVVEDSEVIRDLVADILRGAGIEVRTAANGQEGVEALAERVPDAILCDVEMPVMDGLGLLRHVRSHWPQLPMIMLTTRGSEDDRRQAAALGANAHLIKSGFREDLLLETLRRFLDVRA